MGLALFLVQFLGASIFPGTTWGIQLVVNAISFTAWGYRGLLLNEFTEDMGPWGCPVVSKRDIPLVPNQMLLLGRDVSARL